MFRFLGRKREKPAVEEVTEVVEASAPQEGVTGLESKPHMHSKIRSILELDSSIVVDSLMSEVTAIDREIVLALYSSAMEQSDSQDEQAEFLEGSLRSLGVLGDDDAKLEAMVCPRCQSSSWAASTTVRGQGLCLDCGFAQDQTGNDDCPYCQSSSPWSKRNGMCLACGSTKEQKNDAPIELCARDVHSPPPAGYDPFGDIFDLAVPIKREPVMNAGYGVVMQDNAAAGDVFEADALAVDKGGAALFEADAFAVPELAPEVAFPSKTITCTVCYEDYPEHKIFTFFCGMDQNTQGAVHQLCYECAQGHVEANKAGRSIQCFEAECKHELLPEEIALILGDGCREFGIQHATYLAIDEAKRDYVLSGSMFAQCPKQGCNFQIARSQDGAIEKATCASCNFDFCTNCQKSYHYRSTCDEFRDLERLWNQWKAVGRQQYWKEDEKMMKLVQKEKKRVQSVIETEQADERAKAENCRHCPNCNRIVWKIEGCDIMRCGYDVDTRANRQPGCLSRFSWRAAKPYVPNDVDTSKVSFSAKEKAQHGVFRCDECQKPIFGLRFECMTDPFLNLCDHCEVKRTGVFRIHKPPAE